MEEIWGTIDLSELSPLTYQIVISILLGLTVLKQVLDMIKNKAGKKSEGTTLTSIDNRLKTLENGYTNCMDENEARIKVKEALDSAKWSLVDYLYKNKIKLDRNAFERKITEIEFSLKDSLNGVKYSGVKLSEYLPVDIKTNEILDKQKIVSSLPNLNELKYEDIRNELLSFFNELYQQIITKLN